MLVLESCTDVQMKMNFRNISTLQTDKTLTATITPYYSGYESNVNEDIIHIL